MEKSTDKLQVQENTVEVSELKKLCNITSYYPVCIVPSTLTILHLLITVLWLKVTLIQKMKLTTSLAYFLIKLQGWGKQFAIGEADQKQIRAHG